MRISDWSSDVCSSDLYIVNGDPLNAAQQDIPILPILNMSPPNALGHELRVDPPAGTGFDLAALHGGGGDGASYVDALAENTPYDPAHHPTHPEHAGPAANHGPPVPGATSEAPRVGTEWVSQCSYRWTHCKQKK